ncbi:MAG: hypothetical protein ABIO43_00670 [Sphingomicrobium sp.]
MNDVDEILASVRHAPVPSTLDGMDGLVIEAVTANRNSLQTFSGRPVALAAVGALAIGVFGAFPGARVEAADTVSPFGEVSALAPSHLLKAD